MKKRTLRALCLGLILTLLVACIPAMAADDNDGKISITFQESDIQYRRDGIRVAIYLLATGDYGSWTMASNFSDIQVFTRGDGSLNPDKSLGDIHDRIVNRNIRPTAETYTDGNGTASFGNLKRGIYFVDYLNLPENLKVTSMFLAVPNQKGSVSVSAYAKANPIPTPTPTPTPEPTPTPSPTPFVTQTPSVPTASPTMTPIPTPTPTPGANPYTLTIYYIHLPDVDNPEESEAFPTYFQRDLWPGTPYEINSPVLPGHTVSLLVVKGTMPNHDMVYYVYYKALGKGEYIIEDNPTALGLGNIQMHVGVCFE